MRDGLPPVLSIVGDDPESVVGNVFFLRHILDRTSDFRNKRKVIFHQGGEALDVLFRNDENVNRRLRIDVTEGQDTSAFIDRLRLNLTAGDFTKNTVRHSTDSNFLAPAGRSKAGD